MHDLTHYEPSPEELQLLDDFEQTANQNILDKNALLYVTGYVAHKFRNRYTNLGIPTKALPNLSNDLISTISRGNLMYPSTDFFQTAKIMDEEFIKFHGTSFSKEDKIFDKLTNIVLMKTNNNFPKEAIACLVRTRTYIRLRKMNKDIIQNNLHKKNSKKLYRISNKENVHIQENVIFNK